MTIKWGIIGCGKIAHKFIQDFEFVNQGEVIAVGSRAQKKLRNLRHNTKCRKPMALMKPLRRTRKFRPFTLLRRTITIWRT